MVKSVVADLKANGTVTRGWLGVQIQPITKDIADGLGLKKASGALIADVFNGSPAQEAGFKTGDAVVAMNKKPVKGPKELARMVARLKPDQSITFTILRDGTEILRTVKIGRLPGAEKQATLLNAQPEKIKLASLGLSFMTNTTPNSEAAGVVVSAVDADGPASAKGIKRGDIVLEVSGAVVSSPSDIENRINKISESGKKTALFLVKSKRGKRFIALPLRKA
jgi:serine protease Do